jgi:hypothetical protein
VLWNPKADNHKGMPLTHPEPVEPIQQHHTRAVENLSIIHMIIKFDLCT